MEFKWVESVRKMGEPAAFGSAPTSLSVLGENLHSVRQEGQGG